MFWVLMLLLLVGAAIIMIPFYPAVLWAIVLSVLMWPLYSKLRKKRGGNEAATITVLATIGAVVVPLAATLWMVGAQISAMTHSAKSHVDPNAPKKSQIQQVMASLDTNIGPTVKRYAPEFGFEKWYDENQEQVTKQLQPAAVSGTIQGLTKVGTGALTVVIALLTMFFLLRDGHKLLEPAYELVPLPREKTQAILERLYMTVHGVFVGVVLVSVIQGMLATVGYAVAGVPAWLVFGVATTVLCIIPLLGAPVIYIPMSLLLIFQGKTTHGIGLLLWGFLVVSQIDNVLKPFLIGAKVNMHPMGIFFSVLGGVVVMGPIGLLVGPMLLAVLLTMIEIIREMRALPAEHVDLPQD